MMLGIRVSLIKDKQASFWVFFQKYVKVGQLYLREKQIAKVISIVILYFLGEGGNN